MHLENWMDSKPNLLSAEDDLGEFDRLNWLESWISLRGCAVTYTTGFVDFSEIYSSVLGMEFD